MPLAAFRLRMTAIHVALLTSAAAMGVVPLSLHAQEAPSSGEPPAPIVRQQAPAEMQPPLPPLPPPPPYDPSLFLRPIPPAQLAFLAQFAGAPSGELYNDRQFHKLLKNAVPDCMFHYGRDMPLDQALDTTLSDSRAPVIIREGRYVLLTGRRGPFLDGRGFLWVDMQQGLMLGGFYFHPTNGEPTPALNIFSRQLKEDAIGLSELPPEFNEALLSWSADANLPPITARYFITGANRKILLEHDEDVCSAFSNSSVSAADCTELQEQAADTDLNAADYVEQTHHATNATAWMLSPEQVTWIGIRDRTCGGVVDPLGCRVRMTRERVHVISRPRVPRKP